MNPAHRILESKFPAKAEALHDLRCQLRNALFNINLSSHQVDPLILAVNEACTNIIEHGYAPEQSGEIILEIFFDGATITFQITDFANPISNTEILLCNSDDTQGKGLGIHFMLEIMDLVTFSKDLAFHGNRLIMKKQLEENS